MHKGAWIAVGLILGGVGGSVPAVAQDVQYYPPAYRPYGYYPAPGVAPQVYVPPPPVTAPPPAAAPTTTPPAVPVVPADSAAAPAVVPAPPAVVVPAPVIVVPPRPASCGEFRFWNGFACVDARFNQPYLGPVP